MHPDDAARLDRMIAAIGTVGEGRVSPHAGTTCDHAEPKDGRTPQARDGGRLDEEQRDTRKPGAQSAGIVRANVLALPSGARPQRDRDWRYGRRGEETGRPHAGATEEAVREARERAVQRILAEYPHVNARELARRVAIDTRYHCSPSTAEELRRTALARLHGTRAQG